MPQIAPFDGRAGTSRDGSPVDREQVRSLKIFQAGVAVGVSPMEMVSDEFDRMGKTLESY